MQTHAEDGGTVLETVQRQALAAVGVGVTIADARQPDLPLVWVNPAFAALTGYAPDAVVGRNCRFLQGPGTDPAAVEAIRTAVQAGRGCAVTLLNYRADGTPFWNALTLSPVHVKGPAERGEGPTHYIGVQADVTARVEAERARDRLLAIAAHDLRTPLAALSGTVQLQRRRLQRGQALDAAGQQAQLAVLDDLLARLRAAVDEIGAWSQAQMAQASTLRRARLDVGAVVRAAARTTAWAQGTPVTRVRVEAPSAGPWLVGDRMRLERVLENVIGNALKYSPHGTPVEVAVNARADAAGVTISVRDTGVGIPLTELPRLFDPFYRASTASTVPGTGLGLAGCKALVEQQGGTIAVESAPGQGTTVTITLPHAAPEGRPSDA